jgi:hypothetical protein
MMANIEVTFFESLEGLEARLNGQCLVVLKDYRAWMPIVAVSSSGRAPRAAAR